MSSIDFVTVRGVALVLAVASCFLPGRLVAQTTVWGRVTDSAQLGIPNAEVVVTHVESGISSSSRSATDGRYSITLGSGTGEYTIVVLAPGKSVARLTLMRPLADSNVVANVTLREAARLPKVVVEGRRNVFEQPSAAAIGASERIAVGAFTQARPGGDRGDLKSLSQIVPGVHATEDGFSALGLPSATNRTTLDGVGFSGAALPRNAMVTARLAKTSYDVANGWFSGASLGLSLQPGRNFTTSLASASFDSPTLQVSSTHSRRLEHSGFTAGGAQSGPVQLDKSFYQLTWELSRQTATPISLLHLSPAELQSRGINPLELAALRQQLAGYDVDQTLPSTSQISQNALGLLRFDFQPDGNRPTSVTFNGQRTVINPAYVSATAFPSAWASTTGNGGGLVLNSKSRSGLVIKETRLGLSRASLSNVPRSSQASGRVFLADQPDHVIETQLVSFGGSPTNDLSEETTHAEIEETISWLAGEKHKLKLSGQAFQESQRVVDHSNERGTYTFASLQDLQQLRPLVFTRSLSPSLFRTTVTEGSVGLGDTWQIAKGLELQAGVRLDWGVLRARADTSPSLERASSADVSTRSGFTWRIPGVRYSQLRGGIGRFVAPYSSNPHTIGAWYPGRRASALYCFGENSPAPNWNLQGSDIAMSCADGKAPSSQQAEKAFFDRQFRPVTSVRGNLVFESSLSERYSASVELVRSHTYRLPSFLDLSVPAQPRFWLAAEADRPIFRSAADIDENSGVFTSAGNQARLIELRSDLESRASEITVGLTRAVLGGSFIRLAYTSDRIRETRRGFGGTSFWSPSFVEWGMSPREVRHSLRGSLILNLGSAASVALFGDISSGYRYTPLIAGDVNGDGFQNDRAFVFDPAAAPDSMLQGGMQALLKSADKRTRTCLESQFGKPAQEASCSTPRSLTADALITFHSAALHLPRRVEFQANLTNIPALADRIFHGRSGLRGWGSTSISDPILLIVRGFDPQSQSFTYLVNQNFGMRNSVTSRIANPFELRLTVSVAMERDLDVQQAAIAKELVKRDEPRRVLQLYMDRFPNPMLAVLSVADSLSLTAEQIKAFQSSAERFAFQIEQVWAPFADSVAKGRLNADSAGLRTHELDVKAVEIYETYSSFLRSALAPSQANRLPAGVQFLLDPNAMQLMGRKPGRAANE